MVSSTSTKSAFKTKLTYSLKLHKNLCEAIVTGLEQVLVDGAYAHQVLELLLQSNKKWGARDRSFIAEHFYAIVRYQRLYGYAVGIESISTRAEAWLVLGTYFCTQDIVLPAWQEWLDIDEVNVAERIAEGNTIRKIKESVPDWLDTMASSEMGEVWDSVLPILNTRAPLCIRVNTLKATKEAVINFLQKETIAYKTVKDLPDALLIDSKKNLTNTVAYKSGWFEIQDISSQQVAPLLDVHLGLRVLDACAGAGGKSLHIAALMQNVGDLIAIDVEPEKLKQLEIRSKRNGANIIRPILYNSGLEKEYKKYADRLLLDVPCTGLGVLRRQPDTKWKLTPERVTELTQLQADILDRYSTMVAVGGIIVYATCSILPAEGERQIANFTARNEAFKTVAELKIMPTIDGGDGFYICKMIREK